MLRNIDHSEIEKQVQIGFIAQDVEKAAKEANFNFPGLDVPKNDKEVYALRYVDFIMPLVQSVKELKAENDAVKSELTQLKTRVAEIEQLKAELAEIKELLKTNK
jgi:predicted RNase H-like nuclease (RuvC/YqgF family)